MKDKKEKKKNRGEWSELYVFFKLLADKKLYAADANLNKIEDIYYPVLKILRKDFIGDFEYHTNSVIKIIDSNGTLLEEIPIKEFKDKSLLLLNKIKTLKGRAFEIPELESFLKKIKITKVKGKSSEKRDITIVVHDMFTGFNPKLGFSIKSRIGGDSTLFNSNKNKTNFIYKIKCKGSFSDKDKNEINAINTKRKLKDRVKKIYEKSCKLEFVEIGSPQFSNNLMIIDSSLPLIVAEMLKLYYLAKATTIYDITKILTDNNPLNFDLTESQPFYEYKIKNFLTDTALGMTPETPWKGIYDANGGYIVAKENGEVLCYHIYNHNAFQEYLFKNTKFDSPSSSKHEYGSIYEDNGEFYINLNLQIRFI
ncbi:HpaII family restriction endonuclease [Caminibacter pacificus]